MSTDGRSCSLASLFLLRCPPTRKSRLGRWSKAPPGRGSPGAPQRPRLCLCSSPRATCGQEATGHGQARLSSRCIRGFDRFSCQNKINTFRSENFPPRPVKRVLAGSVRACDALKGRVSISPRYSLAENGCFLLFPLKFMSGVMGFQKTRGFRWPFRFLARILALDNSKSVDQGARHRSSLRVRERWLCCLTGRCSGSACLRWDPPG